MLENGFILLHRDILNWRWFKNANTFRVFIYLLLQANYEPHDFETMTIGRGQLVTSYPKISDVLGITEAQARTAVKHLKATGEITVKQTPKFSVVTVNNYDLYQSFNSQNDSQITGEKQSSNSQMTAMEYSKTKQQSNKINITTTPSNGAGEGFDEFWKAYPKKVAKTQALKAWSKLKPNAELQQVIISALERQKQSVQWQKDNGQFIPYPATWLNGKRWEDIQDQISQPAPPKYEYDPDNPYANWE